MPAPYMTLGEALFEKGFTRTGFYPPDAFEKDPANPKVTFESFDPSVPYVDPHDAAGLAVMEARYGKGVSKAKGSPPGAWHGRETTWQIDDEGGLLPKYLGLVTGFDIDHGWNGEDLKYVCNAQGLFAYEWLIRTYDGLVASEVKPKTGGGAASAKTPLDQRAEEVRDMGHDLYAALGRAGTPHGTGLVYALLSDSCWPLVKPFVVAGIAAYRKIMEG